MANAFPLSFVIAENKLRLSPSILNVLANLRDTAVGRRWFSLLNHLYRKRLSKKNLAKGE